MTWIVVMGEMKMLNLLAASICLGWKIRRWLVANRAFRKSATPSPGMDRKPKTLSGSPPHTFRKLIAYAEGLSGRVNSSVSIMGIHQWMN